MSGRYITWADVTGRYADIKKDKDAPTADNYFIQGAEAYVDAVLAVRYTVPFSPAPDLVRDLCIDLTYIKMKVRGKDTKVLQERFDATISKILDGTLTLVQSGYDFGTPNGAWISSSYHTAFGHDNPINWHRSVDEQLADMDARQFD